jgi:hypothetical protein
MTEKTPRSLGLDAILTALEDRYEFDVDGRLVAGRLDGILPRFVLGRATEGCIWRFDGGIQRELMNAVARLAGRELGFPIAGKCPDQPPERLVMIERLLASGGEDAISRHEILRQDGVPIAELWTID